METAKQEMDIYYAGEKSKAAVTKLFVDTAWNTDYTFRFVGDETEVNNFLDAMRVTISRGRKKARDQRKKIADFNFKVIDTKPSADGEGWIVTVQRQLSNSQKLASELPDTLTDAMENF